jgi:hypothetical protein
MLVLLCTFELSPTGEKGGCVVSLEEIGQQLLKYRMMPSRLALFTSHVRDCGLCQLFNSLSYRNGSDFFLYVALIALPSSLCFHPLFALIDVCSRCAFDIMHRHRHLNMIP